MAYLCKIPGFSLKIAIFCFFVMATSSSIGLFYFGCYHIKV
jgi:hypothetical protein